MLFSRGFLGAARFLAQPGSPSPFTPDGPVHPKVPVGRAYAPAHPPDLWDHPAPDAAPGMPPVMVSHWARHRAPLRTPPPKVWP